MVISGNDATRQKFNADLSHSTKRRSTTLHIVVATDICRHMDESSVFDPDRDLDFSLEVLSGLINTVQRNCTRTDIMSRAIGESFRTIVVGGEPHDWQVVDRVGRGPNLYDEFAELPSTATFKVEFLPRVDSDEWSAQLSVAAQQCRPYHVAVIDAETPLINAVDLVVELLKIDPFAHAIVLADPGSTIPAQLVEATNKSDRVVLTRKPLADDEFQMLINMVGCKVAAQKSRVTTEPTTPNQGNLASQIDTFMDASHVELVAEHKGLRIYAEELVERLQETHRKLLSTQEVTVLALAQLADSRDPETGEHLLRMRAFAQILACYLSEDVKHPEVDADFLIELYRSTPLHDIGKVGIPDNILLKPGKLTRDEFEIMKRHTVIGAQALERATRQCQNSTFLRMAVDIALYHHERFNGRGYPSGLAGDEIPLCARITAVADVFDALTSARVYKAAMPVEEARRLILAEDGQHFDPLVIDAFVHCFEDFVQVKEAIDAGREGCVETAHGFKINMESIVNMAMS